MPDKSEILKKLNNVRLIDIVKNYKQFGYDEDIRNTALSILAERRIDEEILRLTGNDKNNTFESAKDILLMCTKNSKLAFTFYGLMITAKILSSLFGRNSDIMGIVFLMSALFFVICFLVFLLKSFFDQMSFYKNLGKKIGSGDQLTYFLIGMPLYVIFYFYYKNKMKEEIQEIE